MQLFLYLTVFGFAMFQLISAQYTVPKPGRGESAKKYCARVFQGKTCAGTVGYQAFCQNKSKRPNIAQAQSAWNQYAALCQQKIQAMMGTGNPQTVAAAQQLAVQNGIPMAKSANVKRSRAAPHPSRKVKVNM